MLWPNKSAECIANRAPGHSPAENVAVRHTQRVRALITAVFSVICLAACSPETAKPKREFQVWALEEDAPTLEGVLSKWHSENVEIEPVHKYGADGRPAPLMYFLVKCPEEIAAGCSRAIRRSGWYPREEKDEVKGLSAYKFPYSVDDVFANLAEQEIEEGVRSIDPGAIVETRIANGKARFTIWASHSEKMSHVLSKNFLKNLPIQCGEDRRRLAIGIPVGSVGEDSPEMTAAREQAAKFHNSFASVCPECTVSIPKKATETHQGEVQALPAGTFTVSACIPTDRFCDVVNEMPEIHLEKPICGEPALDSIPEEN